MSKKSNKNQKKKTTSNRVFPESNIVIYFEIVSSFELIYFEQSNFTTK